MELATFNIGEALCGVDILSIQEINKHCEVTPIPQADDYIVGVQNLRGQIVTILDLGKKLGLSQVDKNENNRNIIIRFQDEQIGLMVDSISDFVTDDIHNIEAAPSNIGNLSGRFFSGVLKTEKKLIGILDMNEVMKG